MIDEVSLRLIQNVRHASRHKLGPCDNLATVAFKLNQRGGVEKRSSHNVVWIKVGLKRGICGVQIWYRLFDNDREKQKKIRTVARG